MLLQKLVEYSHRPSFEMPPRGYSSLALRYIIELGKDGRCHGLIDTSSPESKGGISKAVPNVIRTSGIRPFLLCDKADYALGFGADKPALIAERHRSFIALLSKCADTTRESSVLAVQAFLADDPVAQLSLPSDFSGGERITFRVDGVFPIDLPTVQDFWSAYLEEESGRKLVQKCICCGESRVVLDQLEEPIKGVPGGQTSGTFLISSNADAFESYNLNASHSAPMCVECGERLTKAATFLLASRQNRTRLADAAFVYWTREEVDFDLIAMFAEPGAEQNAELFNTIWSGRPMPAIDPVRFYATVFTGSGGRAVVRDWIDTTIGEVSAHLRAWFRRQAVVGAYGEDSKPLGLAALAGATVRDLRDVPRPTTRSLLRGALTGQPLPMDLLYQAVRRNRAEQTVTRPRAALIKLVGVSRALDSYEEEKLIELDQENNNPAYRCGRLLAVLEQAQRLAIPGVSAGIIDRYFGTASSTPASVFPRLVRGAQPHLAKLERDRRGAAIALQRRVEDILGGLRLTKVGGLYTGFPSALSLQEQGLFSLGYYHQRAYDRAQAIAARARRNAGSADEPDADLDGDDQAGQ